MHSEDVVSDGTIVGYQPAVIGKLLLNQYNPIECVAIVLFSSTKYDENKSYPRYGFYVHRTKVGNAEIPAKTPDGMFGEDFIPNDLQKVVDAMNRYYNDGADVDTKNEPILL